MSIAGAQVINNARIILSDLTATFRWSDAELVGWLNSGQRDIVSFKPDAFAKPVVIQLVPGTVQTITGLEFIRVNRNMWDSVTPGNAVTPISQELLDVFYPAWHIATPSLAIKHYIFDKRQTQTFMVWPPQPITPGYAEVVQALYPTDIQILNSIITGDILDEIFESALIDYVVYRALSDDTVTTDTAIAGQYRQSFISAIGGRSQAENTTKADTNAR